MTDAEVIVQKLCSLGVPCALERVVTAAQVIRYELKPGDGVKMRDLWRLNRADDLAYELGAESVRIQAPIPGRTAVGIEVARKDRQTVTPESLPRALRPLTVPLGLDVENRPTLLVLDETPHCLVAGQTGSGKSSALRTILCGLVSALGPEDLRLCLVDPKRVEMSAFEDLPHLLFPVADDARKAIAQLHALALTMDDRYLFFARLGARDIKEANAKLAEQGIDPLPYFVCVVDELAELMMQSKKEVEALIVRICQKGRAAGLHVILATQYPKSEILSGLIRVNVPTKICFAVPDQVASRVVLDKVGAEKLLGRGDGLLSFAGLPPVRFQSAFCSPEKVTEVVSRWTDTHEMETV